MLSDRSKHHEFAWEFAYEQSIPGFVTIEVEKEPRYAAV